MNCGVKNYMKVDHHSYRRNFWSCENNNNNNNDNNNNKNNNNNDNNNNKNNNNNNNNNNNKKSTLAVWFLGGHSRFATIRCIMKFIRCKEVKSSRRIMKLN